MIAKFNISDKSFVHVTSHGGEIMMVVSVKDGFMPRYDLQTIQGTFYGNIGEYELTEATNQEVKEVLERTK